METIQMTNYMPHIYEIVYEMTVYNMLNMRHYFYVVIEINHLLSEPQIKNR